MHFLLTLDPDRYTLFLYCWGALGLVSAASIYFLRMLPLSNRMEGPQRGSRGVIDKRLGWVLMEVPVLATVIWCYWASAKSINYSIIMVAAFVFHYINRALIYPWRVKVRGKKMPIGTMLSSMLFYIVNGYLIGYYFGALRAYPASWLYDPRFIAGMLMFVAGFAVNVRSDNILIGLRKPGESGYKIPTGGMFRYISCPNYFGEMLEWAGFAVMSWSLPGLVYALWVDLPLFAQALLAHRWYLQTFGKEYPPERKAVIPGVI
ncbi:MAG: 3-oxo-5-alpha-steroid 4-dehydrogenase [Nevskia sp.]|nr:3-oxo-5-alpha-steroid 4-dehydrogenase [Nevskia sp.]